MTAWRILTVPAACQVPGSPLGVVVGKIRHQETGEVKTLIERVEDYEDPRAKTAALTQLLGRYAEFGIVPALGKAALDPEHPFVARRRDSA